MNIIIGSDSMKLIVGLGNPGKEYTNTRHNVGFNFLDYYLDSKNITDTWSKKFDGLYIQTSLNGEKVIFLKPQTFMNLSGNSVRKVMDYFNIEVDDLLVISDDLDLSIGNFKLRPSGTSGGHNGLKSIESSIGTNSYKRLKIGISNDKGIDTKDYVLGNLSKEDKDTLNNLYKDLCGVVDDYFHIEFPELMNKYNRKNR
jgi:PTH1 family peptidyl-tRNA hydrolase